LASSHHSTSCASCNVSSQLWGSIRKGRQDEKSEQNTWSRFALILLELHGLVIFITINFKKLNLGQLILIKVTETAACHQTAYFEAKMHKIRFRLGLLRGKRSFGLHARRWYGQQILICLFQAASASATSGEDGLNHPAVCTLLCTVRRNCGRCYTSSAVLQLQAWAIHIRFLVASR